MERRQQTRYQVCLGGELIWDGGANRQRCTIRDISIDGARIETAFFVDLPKQVFLMEDDSSSLFECEVKWQLGTKLGLFFIDVGGRTVRRRLISGNARPT